MKISLLFLITLFCSAIFSFAQTGPGGVGNTSSNPLWLDANRITGLSNGSQVQTWNDVSGNGNNARQANSSLRPLYITGEVNNKPVVRFDGSNDYMQTSSIAALNTNQISWFIIASAPNNQTGMLMRSSYTSGATNSTTMWGTFLSSNNNSYNTATRSLGGTATNINLGYQAGFNVLSSVWYGTSSQLNGYRNGSLIGTAGNATANPAGHQYIRLGANSGSLGYYLQGDIAEAVVYSTALNEAQRIIVDNYLAAKYNLSMSANDKYAYEGTYGNELAGIGREDASNIHTEAQGTSIVRISNPTNLENGEYLMWGHDGDNLNPLNQDDVPSTYTINGGSRFERIWRAGETGEAGTVTLSFYLSGVGFGDPLTYELLIDQDGTFGDGNATQHITGRSYNATTNILTFTNVSLNDGDYFTLGASQAIISIASGSWNNPSTWNCNCVPETGYFTLVDNGHNVTIDANSTVGTLVIRPTGTVSITNSFSLTLSRNLTNTGTFIPNTGSVIFATSGGAQTISSTSLINFYNLTINNTSVSNTVSITGGSYTLANTLTLLAGNLNTNSNSFTMRSTATRTARIAPIPVGSSISGSFIVQRFMSGRAANWHDLASPVQNSTLADWDNEMYLAGINGPDGNICCPAFYSVYKYNEPTSSYEEVTTTTEPLSPGRGFMVWLADNTTTWTAKAWDTRGVPTQGNQSFSLPNTSSGDGWHLVGNPFASFIAWDSVHASSSFLNPTMNIMNNGTYESYAAGSGFAVPPSQGFWIHANGTSTIMRVNESAKTTSNASTFYKTIPKEFRLTIRSNINEFSNITKIALNENAAEEFEQFDGRFKKSPYPEAPAITTYSTDNAIDLSYNSINSANDYILIPVKAKVGVSGKYTIDFAGLSTINEQYPCVLFEDTKTGEIIDLKDKSSYSFNISSEEDNTRFKVHMMKSYNKCELVVADVTAPIKKDEIAITRYYVDFNMEKATSAKISIYNMLGQKVMEDVQVKASSDRAYLNTSKLNGMHFIVVETAESRISEKINFMNF